MSKGKSKIQYIQSLLNIVLIIFKVFNILQDAKRLVFTELKRSGRNFFAIIFYGVLLLVLLCFAWFCIMAIIYVKLHELSSPFIALLSILGLHLVIILVLALLLSNAKRDFYASRKEK